MLFVANAFTVAAATNSEKIKLTTEKNSSQPEDVTLITDLHLERVIEVDTDGYIVWEYQVGLPFDAERLENGNTLITDFSNEKVIEVDRDGNIVWEFSLWSEPYDVERLDNGNTLITMPNGEFLIEVDSDGFWVWSIFIIDALDAERLDNGNTLIATGDDVREVNYNGEIVWQITGLNEPFDAERLDNGNTLITEADGNRVIEIDSNGNIIWEITGLVNPTDAERLENGNTLIADTNGHRVIEVDSDGYIVWEYQVGLPFDAERVTSCVNQPPNTPSITGPTSGMAGVEYCWTFHSEDPNGDQIKYIIDWGDGTTTETECYPSCTPVEVCHTYTDQGTYVIKAKAKECTQEGLESIWSEPFIIEIVEPIINIGKITGGFFKLKANIKNVGNGEANNVSWNIIINGGLIVIPRVDSGDLGTLGPGDSANVTMSPMGFGLGVITPIPTITVTATCAEGSSAEKSEEARIILFFILIK